MLASAAMEKIYSHMDFARVGHYEAVLKQSGIPCFLKNTHASTLMGEVPYLEIWPEIWVHHDADVPRAREILAELQHGVAEPIAPWICPQCRTDVEAGFSECWNCGASNPQLPL